MNEPTMDPLLRMAVEARLVQPFQARKTYKCPSCAQDVLPGVAHMVVVPIEQPDWRRHWHKHCWARGQNLGK